MHNRLAPKVLIVVVMPVLLLGQTRVAAADPAGEAIEAMRGLYQQFDGASRGEVPLRQLREHIVKFEASEVKVLDFLRGWDADGNEHLSLPEMRAGVLKAVEALVEAKMKLDSDGDGVLSTAEYLLGLPPGSEGARGGDDATVDANGLTQRQREVMNRQDRNKDGVVSREEVLATQAGRLKNGFALMAFAMRAGACDWNRDGVFDLREFAMVMGVKPEEEISARIHEQFLGREKTRKALTAGQLYDVFSHGMAARLKEFEAHLADCRQQRPRQAN